MKFGFRSGNKGSKANIDSNLNPFGKPATNEQQNNGNNGGGNNNNPAPNNGQARDPNVEFKKFCRDSGMFENLDLEGFVEAVGKGDTAKAAEFFMESMLSTARVAMAGADRLATAKMNQAMEATAVRASAMTSTQLLTNEMHERLGFTKDPAMAPLAEDVLNRFLAKGESADVALDNTEKYFKEFALAAGGKFGMMAPNTDMRPGQRGFNDSRMQQNDNSESVNQEMDWMDVLTSGAVSEVSPPQGSNGGAPNPGNAGNGNPNNNQ